MSAWDLQLQQQINREWSNAFFDWLMPVLSAIELWMPILGGLLVVLAWRGGMRLRLMLLACAVAVGVGDGVVGKALKSKVNRARPRDAMSGVIIRDVAKVSPRVLALFAKPQIKESRITSPATSGNSFPSNHTINLFAVATVVALFFRRWALPMYCLAGAVAYSRVYVGAHWPSDLPASVAIGILIGGISAAMALRWLSRRGSLDHAPR